MWKYSKNGLYIFTLHDKVIININRIYHIKFSDDRPRYNSLIQGYKDYKDSYSFGVHTDLDLLKFKCLIKAKDLGWNIKYITI